MPATSQANVIFDENGEPIAIDNNTNAYSTTTPAMNAQFTSYTKHVGQLVATAAVRARGADSLPCHPAIQGVIDFFTNGQGGAADATHVPGMGYAFKGPGGALEIERGILQVADRLWELGGGSGQLECLFETMEADVRRELCWVTCDEAMLGLSRVQASFFAKVAYAMCAHKTAH